MASKNVTSAASSQYMLEVHMSTIYHKGGISLAQPSPLYSVRNEIVLAPKKAMAPFSKNRDTKISQIHSVTQGGKMKNFLSLKIISSNQLISNFFSKTVTFTKFLPRKCENKFPYSV